MSEKTKEELELENAVLRARLDELRQSDARRAPQADRIAIGFGDARTGTLTGMPAPCTDARGHLYPAAWWSVVPPHCQRCGQQAPDMTTRTICLNAIDPNG